MRETHKLYLGGQNTIDIYRKLEEDEEDYET